MTYPKFGAAGAVEQETLTYGTDELEYRDGFSTDVFDLKHTNTLKRSAPSFAAATYGIGASTDDTRNSLGVPFDTVTLAEEEETTNPHMVATNPGVSPALGDKLTYCDGVIYHRVRKTLTLNGKGDPPEGMTEANRGETFADAILIKPAVGDTPAIDEPGGWYIRRVELGKTVSDWQKFTVEMVKYIGNTPENAQDNILTPTLFTTGELDAISAYWKLSRTITLNATDKANVDETVELYDDIATP